MKKYKKGFTLIELLVVIAIIGILASVVLASLNSARNKGADAAVKADLANARAQAELFYDAGSTYSGVCATTGTNVIGPLINAAEKAYGNTTPTTYALGTASTYNTGQCHDSQGAWAAFVPLKASVSGSIVAWCVDNSGASKQVTTTLDASKTVCP
jgi:prepilin-type N-terminal cleavage/methylation domain-containing protein